MSDNDHFKGKGPMQHIVEVQANGMTMSAEVHGAETPGALFACLDSFRESMLWIAFFVLVGHFLDFGLFHACVISSALFLGYALWRGCRAVHIANFRLERLHRVALEEKKEIETNRDQEKEELKALYKAKGFEGKLLDDVVDVLMADNERCLRVMLEEEMGFRLRENQHPLVQGLGGALGVLFSFLLSLLLSYFGLLYMLIGAIGISAISWAIIAKREKNRIIPAVVWGASEMIASLAVAYFILRSLLVGSTSG